MILQPLYNEVQIKQNTKISEKKWERKREKFVICVSEKMEKWKGREGRYIRKRNASEAGNFGIAFHGPTK